MWSRCSTARPGKTGRSAKCSSCLGLPYVGSRPGACRVAFDKPVAKVIVERAGIRTPASIALPAETFRELGAALVMEAMVAKMGLPLIVKPAKSGSALGCTLVRSSVDLPGAMVGAYAYGDTALVEQFIEGDEVAVPVLDTPTGPEALPIVAIHADGGIYDYTARYTAGSTEFVVPAQLSAEATNECARIAVLAHRSLGLRDLSRSDLIVDADGEVWFLEVNVAPGLTETSTVPLSINAAGLDLGEVYASLVATAQTREGERVHA